METSAFVAFSRGAKSSALFEISYDLLKMKKAGPLIDEGTGMVETIYPAKKKAGDPSAWRWGSPAKREGQIETIEFMIAPFLRAAKSRVLSCDTAQNPAEISYDNFLKTRENLWCPF